MRHVLFICTRKLTDSVVSQPSQQQTSNRLRALLLRGVPFNENRMCAHIQTLFRRAHAAKYHSRNHWRTENKNNFKQLAGTTHRRQNARSNVVTRFLRHTSFDNAHLAEMMANIDEFIFGWRRFAYIRHLCITCTTNHKIQYNELWSSNWFQFYYSNAMQILMCNIYFSLWCI